MRSAIAARGSREDVRPYIASGKGLKKSGNVAQLVTHQNYQVLVNSHGSEFRPVEGLLAGAFGGDGVHVGTMDNGGVDMAPFHDFEDQIRGEINAGSAGHHTARH